MATNDTITKIQIVAPNKLSAAITSATSLTSATVTSTSINATISLDALYRVALENANRAKEYRKRYVYSELRNLLSQFQALKNKKPCILIPGIRGIGKTTIMLQLFSDLKDAFYFTADSLLVKSSTLYSLVEQAHRTGYKTVFIDEIHRYPNWAAELKNIYDSFNVQIVASGSSTAAIKKGSLFLGRRAYEIPLFPLSFGEYVYLQEGQRYEANIIDILNKRASIQWIADHPSVEKHYNNYLLTGGFPFRLEERGSLFSLMKKMIYEDALTEFNLSEAKVDVAERILSFLAASKLGEFSYTSFSSTSGYSKSTVYEGARLLIELELLRVVSGATPKAKANETVKILFSHPNLRAAFADQLMVSPDIGALREEYFVFHLSLLGIPVFLPKKMKKNPDYEAVVFGKHMIFEIGTASKTKKQLQGLEGAVLDPIGLMVLGFVQKTNQK
ncbi:TPA: AAA family ATPase [Candidatus Micrarchaeota archaeon]|nr:AAA family ATPase [Candidatus Micrarchaeota archaeon]